MIEVLYNSTLGCFESTDFYIQKRYVKKNGQLVVRNLLNYEKAEIHV